MGALGKRGAGVVKQIVNLQDGEVGTGTNTIPQDDTIPQNTEGDEYMILSITPTNVNNIITVRVGAYITSSSTNTSMIMALFKDSVANALAMEIQSNGIADTQEFHTLEHQFVAGTLSPITLKVRAGGAGAGTTTFNGFLGARKFGGVSASHITIMETTP